ncbi:hypothetical protein CEXT_444041 [Caerostris extrusa]|uniref:Uncharacterized protein n=1 Tax=Caerostris extrusa TaxID=172846 RepID=A0AAV4XIH3_CAEEX|nr:hypothetical protein CEXT_444041 [Caerostris extrusa]
MARPHILQDNGVDSRYDPLLKQSSSSSCHLQSACLDGWTDGRMGGCFYLLIQLENDVTERQKDNVETMGY